MAKKVAGRTLDEALAKMRGPVDTPMPLTLARPGKEEPFDATLIRALVQLKTVAPRLKRGVIALSSTLPRLEPLRGLPVLLHAGACRVVNRAALMGFVGFSLAAARLETKRSPAKGPSAGRGDTVMAAGQLSF